MNKLKPYFSYKPLWLDGVAIVRMIVALLIGFHGVVVFMPDLMIHNARIVHEANVWFPLFTAYLGKSIELLGSIALLLGLGTRICSALLSGMFFILTFVIHDGNIFNSETAHPFLFFLLSLMFLLVGPGRFSVDWKLNL